MNLILKKYKSDTQQTQYNFNMKNINSHYKGRLCHYHPDEQIHNFCTSKTCALPLCPKCIQMHLYQSRQAHEIKSYRQTCLQIQKQLAGNKQLLYNELNLLHTQCSLNGLVAIKIQQIQQKRKSSIAEINKIYNIMKNNLEIQISKLYYINIDPLLKSLENKYEQINKYYQQFNHGNQMQVCINVISEQIFTQIDKIMREINVKRQNIFNTLPKLNQVSFSVSNDNRMNSPNHGQQVQHHHHNTNPQQQQQQTHAIVNPQQFIPPHLLQPLQSHHHNIVRTPEKHVHIHTPPKRVHSPVIQSAPRPLPIYPSIQPIYQNQLAENYRKIAQMEAQLRKLRLLNNQTMRGSPYQRNKFRRHF